MDFQTEPVCVSRTDTGCKIEIIGGVHTNVAWLESELKKVIAAKPQRVDLDLSQTTFLSSTGIGTLTWLRNNLVKQGGALEIVAIQHNVLETLRYARLLEFFQIGPATTVSHP